MSSYLIRKIKFPGLIFTCFGEDNKRFVKNWSYELIIPLFLLKQEPSLLYWFSFDKQLVLNI